MKIMGLVLLIVMTGCSVGPTMAELETQAMLTGDWSAVERRERAIERRRQRQGMQCPAGFIAYCDNTAFDTSCTCIDHDDLYRALSWQ